MNVFNYQDITPKDVGNGAKGVKIRWLIHRKLGAKNFEMRLFEVDRGGYTPYHTHPWEHEVFVLEGNGFVKSEKGNIKIGPGSVVFVKPDEPHQFVNAGDGLLKFICVIPVID